ncbi:copper resistance CopC family protein [Catenuloplanes japonicus]|uniref:copper resistance protein CopC n=1 Tax=Catenuloplanes japonicus TaxID=33876 RepID=UPI000524B141|nr:copper resistance protein CopC [Catenuloplanes japonicus]
MVQVAAAVLALLYATAPPPAVTLLESSPADGTTVAAPPPVVTLRLDTPRTDVAAIVLDGCGRVVPGTVVVLDRKVSIRLAATHRAETHTTSHAAAGGIWQVAWRSGDDAGRLSFRLAGESVCGQVVAAPEEGDIAVGNGQGPAMHRVLYVLAAAGLLMTAARLLTRARRTPRPA